MVTITRVARELTPNRREMIPSRVTLLHIRGPFLPGTTEKLIDATSNIEAFRREVILRLRNMSEIDATGIHAVGTCSTAPSRCTPASRLCRRADPGRWLTTPNQGVWVTSRIVSS